ncbi:cystathionine gamma-lyase-like [Artemia franciscana]|uniref:cystathionine gamma-lyase n=1 Tax=Artemia franciscana TaxID=6661 RepID=A0AA88L870_ARTSF|nr:hypothetical protein QYM36_002546 [Artemia franciscana]
MSMENGVVHSGFKEQSKDFATRALHDGQEPEQWESRAVVPPISLSTTFKQDGPAQHRGFEYGRSGNPTRNVLEAALASLESAKYALTFASGLAATTTITQMFSNGDHIVSMDDLYGGTNRYLRQVADRLGITTTFVDAAVPENVQKAVQPNTKLVWIETPTNPLMKLVDIGKIAKITHAAGAILVVDNTFMSSYFQRPLELGADIVMHSLTKYMNGHSDVIMGAAMTSDEEIHKKLRFLQNAIGAVPSPFDCYLVNRSLKTLHLRMRQHMENGIKVAKFLESHPLVEKVIFPGLPSHPQHELAKKQCHGSSGMMSFYIKGGLMESKKFFKALKIFSLAESLGGFESLAELPALMTHASVPDFQRQQLGIGDNLIRLSVGLEDADELIADLDAAIKASAA